MGGAHPSPLLYHNNLPVQQIKLSGFALGMVKNVNYIPQVFDFTHGDTLFLYTDGAVENFDEHDIAHKNFMHQRIEDSILKKTSNVALEDDVALLEFHLPRK